MLTKEELLDRYYYKILKDLALFRYYYNLPRQAALELPSWEWDSLLDEITRIHAERDLQAVYAVSSGFNGGDFANGYMSTLSRAINHRFEVETRVNKSLDEVMPGLDSLLPSLSSSSKRGMNNKVK